MLLLAVDTSGRNGSLALARLSGGAVEVVEEVVMTGAMFSAQLVPQTAALLTKHGYSKADLAGFTVVSGPGSFTGLRVGLAAIKAMAEILRKPIAAISLLEAIARNGAGDGRVFSLLDAGRGDYYVGDYELGPPVHMHSERLLSREEFSAENKRQLVITTDTNLAETVRNAGFRVELAVPPRSGDIARFGWERIQRGETVLPEDLEANYLRRTDAEIFSKPKL
jgi:tRNA threonylcarbamoyladenosine biosynthesis protein TsaB